MAGLKTKAEALEELGLDSTAPDQAIRAAFRQHLKQAHPDLTGGTDAQLRRLILARDMLMSGSDISVKPTDPYRQFDTGNALADKTCVLSISLHQALFGGSVSTEVPALEFAEADEPLASLVETKCLQIALPAGLRDGAVASLACNASGRQECFRIHIETDDDCRVWGNDIWMTARIENRLLRGGGQIIIDTPHGPRHIHIEARTQSGASLRLKALGLPATEAAQAGDLNIRLEARPDSLRPAGNILNDFRQRWAS